MAYLEGPLGDAPPPATPPKKLAPKLTSSQRARNTVVSVYAKSFAYPEFVRRFLPCNAMLSAVYAIVECPSVCVCVSVTLRYGIKTAKRRITQ